MEHAGESVLQNQHKEAGNTVTQLHANSSGGAAMEDNRPRTVAQLRIKNAASSEVPVQRKANNTGLPDNLKSGIENLSGHSMDDVKVHYNSSAPAQLNAHAYAQGNQIHVAPGQEKHVPHEAWHVVQQKEGRVKPTMQMKGKVNVNDDSSLEKEADVMGAKALGPAVQKKAMLHTHSVPGSGIVQRAAAATALKYAGEDVVNGDDRVESVAHRRGSPLLTATQYAWNRSPFSHAAGGAVANHHAGAQTLINRIISNKMEGNDLSDVATNLRTAYNTLQGYGHGLGAATAGHRQVINSMAGDPDRQEDRGTMDAAVNYYMHRIYDYPQNLFYWPATSGGDPDYPLTAYEDDDTGGLGLPAGWAFDNNQLGEDPNDRLQATEDRVQQGRTQVRGATA